MTHEDALNMILAEACPETLIDDYTRTFRITAHCTEVIVTARLVSTMNTIRYEILSVTIEG